jgi:cytochrome c1
MFHILASPKKRRALAACAAALACALLALGITESSQASSSGHGNGPAFSFEAPFGGYDRAALQRGYQVYKEVCATCHSLNLVAYRSLGEPGGPEFSEAEVKALAAQAEIPDGPDDSGNMFARPGRPSDYFKAPYVNEQLARLANNGALPPDLSVIAKAREGGPQHVYGILTGYGEPPVGFKELPPGQYYNAHMDDADPNTVDGVIAMPPPLTAGMVTYADGMEASVDQMARDVTTFLMWAAEPKLEARKRIGFQVTVFLVVLAGLLFLAMRRVWRDTH